MFEIRFHYHPRSKVAEWQTLVFIGVVLRTRWARSQAGKQGSKSHVSSNRLLSSSFHRVYLSSVLDQAFRGLPSDLEVALGSSVVLPCQARETRITTTDKYKKHKDLELHTIELCRPREELQLHQSPGFKTESLSKRVRAKR